MAFLNYEVEGLSKKDNEELGRQLKLLNKPAIKTIKTEYGDIYDCVDFYQQPAFDHPLLKNHTYYPQMKPSFSLLKRDKESSTSNSSFKMGLKDGGCPMGTVPIRRTTKEDLIRERRFNASYARGTFHFALEQTSNDPRNQISGAGTTASMYNPKVLPNQWSASVVKVQNGRDQIQAGWRVDPILYGDTHTRFYSLFKIS
ncbi:protein neprosin-like [Nicotiana tomentosiformis]|uniref:protein neprosin-like n=1 Tax=Nicotiana tomentosiformis TaxID=4098 RepID=UPI00388CCA89